MKVRTPRTRFPPRISPLRKWLAGAAVSTSAFAGAVFGATPPNIVVLLMDDWGWEESGAYGSDFFETPHVDRLAREGMRFTQAYSPAPICSAARAAILTGRSPARLGIEFVTQKPGFTGAVANTRLLQPAPAQHLPLGETTMAEVLQPAGYVCGYVGKWHLTEEAKPRYTHGTTQGPLQQGFDYADATFGAHPFGYGPKPPAMNLQPGEFPPDSSSDSAIRFIRENRTRPFFLFFSSFFPHVPVHSPARWLVDRFRKKKELGVTSGNRAAYGAFVTTMDHYVGKILGALDDMKLRENTVVILTSDNGPDPRTLWRSPLSGGKWTLREGGIRIPFIVRWPAKVAAATLNENPIIGMDLLPTLADLAGTPLPADVPIDGQSLGPMLREHSARRWAERTLFWHYPNYNSIYTSIRPHAVVRQGDWKLIYQFEDQSSELFNLRQDLGEKENLSIKEPARTVALRKILLAHLHEMRARIPVANPDFDPTKPALTKQGEAQP